MKPLVKIRALELQISTKKGPNKKLEGLRRSISDIVRINASMMLNGKLSESV